MLDESWTGHIRFRQNLSDIRHVEQVCEVYERFRRHDPVIVVEDYVRADVVRVGVAQCSSDSLVAPIGERW